VDIVDVGEPIPEEEAEERLKQLDGSLTDPDAGQKVLDALATPGDTESPGHQTESGSLSNGQDAPDSNSGQTEGETSSSDTDDDTADDGGPADQVLPDQWLDVDTEGSGDVEAPFDRDADELPKLSPSTIQGEGWKDAIAPFPTDLDAIDKTNRSDGARIMAVYQTAQGEWTQVRGSNNLAGMKVDGMSDWDMGITSRVGPYTVQVRARGDGSGVRQVKVE
jgi:hypothetical protein